MAFHESRFWVFTAAAPSHAVLPQADCSPAHADAEARGTDREAKPREPEWQGQWRLLKYL